MSDQIGEVSPSPWVPPPPTPTPPPARILYTKDNLVEPEMDSWGALPDNFELLIQESPNYSLLINNINKLLIQ